MGLKRHIWQHWSSLYVFTSNVSISHELPSCRQASVSTQVNVIRIRNLCREGTLVYRKVINQELFWGSFWVRLFIYSIQMFVQFSQGYCLLYNKKNLSERCWCNTCCFAWCEITDMYWHYADSHKICTTYTLSKYKPMNVNMPLKKVNSILWENSTSIENYHLQLLHW